MFLQSVSFDQSIAAYTLVFLRTLGVLLPIPIAEGINKPMAKVAFAGLLALLIIPYDEKFLLSATITPSHILAELVYGVILGLPLALIISLASSFGEIFDAGRGQSISQIYDPNQQQQVSNMGAFWHEAAILAAFLYGAPQVMLQLLGASFRAFSHPDCSQILNYKFSKLLVQIISQAWSQMMLVALLLLSLFLIVEIFFAMIAKVTPQISLNSEIFQAKSFLAFSLTAAAGLEYILRNWFASLPSFISSLL